MAGDGDELETNPFYISLQTKFMDLYERAQNNCYILCVPQQGSFDQNALNVDFVESHILRPSPYFKGQFMTTHSSKSKTIKLTEDGQFLTSLQGFEEQVMVKILAEELAYNKDYKQYRILILQEPLDFRFKVKGLKQEEQRAKQLHTHKITVKECTEFLKSFPEFKGCVESLDKKVEYFCRHYMVLPEYLDDASSRLRTVSTDTHKEMLKKLKPALSGDLKLREVLAGAVESYIMSAVYYKVFVVIRQRFTQDDQLLLSKCHKLNRVRAEDIGVRNEFSCPLPSAVVELANLGSLITPREKLMCLKSTVDNVTEGLTAFLKEKKRTSYLENLLSEDDQDTCITTDDLIPIIVTVIAQAKSCHLQSDLFFVENFMWDSTDRDRDDLGFCLVSFKAAVQYMRQTDFSHLRESTSEALDKEISIEDLMAVTSIQDSSHARPPSSSSRQSPSSETQTRQERQLTRISCILEQTSREMGQQVSRHGQLRSIFPERVLKSSLPDVLPSQSKSDTESSQLGDFLSALQSDEFNQSFGKQT